MATPEVHRPAYVDQNVVVAFFGEDGGYFVGRQTPELAVETMARIERLPHKILEIIDCTDDPSMTGIVADDIRATYAENYLQPEQYRI